MKIFIIILSVWVLIALFMFFFPNCNFKCLCGFNKRCKKCEHGCKTRNSASDIWFYLFLPLIAFGELFARNCENYGCVNFNSLTVKPVLDRLIIKQSEGKKEVAGMIIPESEREKPCRGIVVAAGPGFRNSKGDIVPMTAKVGDEVAYLERTATKIEIDNVDYIYIKEGDLILIF